MKPSINSIEVKALQKIVSEWENNKLKNTGDAITSTTTDGKITSSATTASGGTFKEAKSLNTDNNGVVNTKIKTPMPPQIPASLNEEVSDATPITTGYDKTKSDLSGVVRLNSDTSGAKLKALTSGSTTSTASNSTITDSSYSGSATTYTFNADALTATTTAWLTDNSGFALNTATMANNTSDMANLYLGCADSLASVGQSPSVGLTVIQ